MWTKSMTARMFELATVGYVVTGLAFLGHWTHGLDKYHYFTKDMCSQTITVDRKAAVTMSFSSGRSEVDFDESCKVRVEGGSSTDRLLFRFRFFDIDRYCADSNLTVYDGNIYSSYVQGLRPRLCGKNSTLLRSKSTFNSKQNYLTLLFRRNHKGMYFNSSFVVEFTTYREKKWCSETNTEYRCYNGWCIDKSLRCKYNLNPCGDHSDCKGDERRDSTSESFSATSVLESLMGLLFMVALYVSFRWCKGQRRENGHFPCDSLLSCLFSRRRRRTTLRGGSSRNRNQSARQNMATGTAQSTTRRDFIASTNSPFTDSDHSDDWLENEADYLELDQNSREPNAMMSADRGETNTSVTFPASPRDNTTGFRFAASDFNFTYPPPTNEATILNNDDSNTNVTTVAIYDPNQLPPSYDDVINAPSAHVPPPSYHDVIANEERYFINSS